MGMVRCERCGTYNIGVIEVEGVYVFNQCRCPIPVEPHTIRHITVEAGINPDYPLVREDNAVR